MFKKDDGTYGWDPDRCNNSSQALVEIVNQLVRLNENIEEVISIKKEM